MPLLLNSFNQIRGVERAAGWHPPGTQAADYVGEQTWRSNGSQQGGGAINRYLKKSKRNTANWRTPQQFGVL